VLYAHIIRKAYPAFGKMMTDKGYKPDDLLNLPGKLNIAKGYIRKIIRKPQPDFDSYGVAKAWEINKVFWLKVPVTAEFFNLNGINPEIKEEILFKILSLSYLLANFNLPPRH